MLDCHDKTEIKGADLTLVGNPNVGKSSLFNHLTKGNAIISNYPGTTVDVLEGNSKLNGIKLRVADLPGIYSLDGLTEDEKVARDYLKKNKNSLFVHIVDARSLERGLRLFFEMRKFTGRIIVALNFLEQLESEGVFLDIEKLQSELSVPVISINAKSGSGIERLLDYMGHDFSNSKKLVVNQSLVRKKAKATAVSVIRGSGKSRSQRNVFLDRMTTEYVSGSFILFLVLCFLFFSLFYVGGAIEDFVSSTFEKYAAPVLIGVISMVGNKAVEEVLRWVFVLGIEAGLSIAIPYIFVFYFILGILEDTGYMPRIAYLLDKLTRKIGLHGKAIVPMILGFGCSVPAILATRTLSNDRERFLTSILIVLIPCSARTAIILGAAGHYLGWQYGVAIYLITLVIMGIVGWILAKKLGMEDSGLLLELPRWQVPSISNLVAKTWIRMVHFLKMAFPLVAIGSGILGGLKYIGLLEPLLSPFNPLISGWLLLPKEAGITLLFGILRKELALELLISLGGSANLLAFMTPLQIFVFSLVTTLYIPCIATVAVLKREFGLKRTILLSLGTIFIAVLIGGLIARLFIFLGILV